MENYFDIIILMIYIKRKKKLNFIKTYIKKTKKKIIINIII